MRTPTCGDVLLALQLDARIPTGVDATAGFSWRFSTVPEVRASHDTPAAVGLVGRG